MGTKDILVAIAVGIVAAKVCSGRKEICPPAPPPPLPPPRHKCRCVYKRYYGCR